MRLVFAGTPEPAVVALQKLLDSDHEVVAVLTRPDARRGRGRSLHPSPVKALAEEHGIEVLTPDTLRGNEEIRQRLAELAPDAIPVVAYGNLIPEDMLDIAPHGWVNLHFSLLPKWRGAAPVQAAIRDGDAMTGATTFRIDAGLDTGDILATVEEPIQPTDTADDLLTRLAHTGSDLLVETMTALENGTASPVAQPEEGTYARKITPENARVTWSDDAAEIDRHVRAHTPGPGAWTTWQESRVKLGPVTVSDHAELAPGHVRVEKNAVFVGTGSADVQLGLIQPPGKKMMDAAAWARGLSPEVTEQGVVFQ
ncbi:MULTISPECIES: methionyl-tRNA formyltransferase [unclassified Corynebacterium]|uniref:methionyl-tRNA formyltransferase n=1 Tax=unclassified Corynebacterium TaxID=2624378 RepID=UPI002A91CF15|nr:methionyl-tRNA formyltransferase [Corynebacterium sp.]MDY5786172.1 methionyl-tRNA formyltransferase [Corynebacterium sp.]